ncbi:multidrug DMT transporter permease [Legionella dresdenensis]|uniref:Multidrug DMT transporter permease n=1 Tax=Legionella dresdenensis TaxID=450200 RepID=A0ABV8CGM2_9GAMM
MRLIALLFILFSFAAPLQASVTKCEQQYCVAIVDVGSTGSRLHIYSYDLDATSSPVAITERWSKKIKPGFATIEANAGSVDAYLSTLFAGAPDYSLPVYFYATAGMRLLPQPKQQQYYSLVQSWFKNRQDRQLIEAKTITGSEEGLLGWLAVNYQLGNFTNTTNPTGVLDMGGASVQIVLPVTNPENINPRDLKQFQLYGRKITLFIHSFLGLGSTEVTHQYLDTPSCFSTDYPLPDGFGAQGDAYQCESEIASLMNAVHHVDTTVQPVIQANPVKQWYTLGGINDLAKNQPLNFAQQFTNQALLDEANSQICQQPWTILSTAYPSNEYLYSSCLSSAYYYALIVEGYGISSQQQMNYLSDDKPGDWTLGVVLNQSVQL